MSAGETVKVLLEAREQVKYRRVVDLPKEEFEQLCEMRGAERERAEEQLVEKHLDRMRDWQDAGDGDALVVTTLREASAEEATQSEEEAG